MHGSLPFHYEFGVWVGKVSAFLHLFLSWLWTLIQIVGIEVFFPPEVLVNIFEWTEKVLELNRLKILPALFWIFEGNLWLQEFVGREITSSNLGEYTEFFFSSHL